MYLMTLSILTEILSISRTKIKCLIVTFFGVIFFRPITKKPNFDGFLSFERHLLENLRLKGQITLLDHKKS
jgi:hypothetical protein